LGLLSVVLAQTEHVTFMHELYRRSGDVTVFRNDFEPHEIPADLRDFFIEVEVACGAPWKRVVDVTRTFESGSGRAGNMPNGKNGASLQGGGATLDIRRGPTTHTTTTGWSPSCACDAGEPVPQTVLDPFSGAGTTGLVADRLGRHYIGVEINPEYVTMSEARIRNDAPLFAMEIPA